MKTTRILLSVMIAASLLQDASLARPSNAVPQQAPSQGGEKSASDHPSAVQGDVQKDGEVRGGGNHTGSGKASLARTTTKRRPSVSHSKPLPTRQPHPAKTPTASSPRIEVPGGVSALQQTGSNVATSLPKKAVARRSPSAPEPAVSVNGQHFKNSRDPGARLAISGGPPTAAKGTAAINGTNMKRRP